MGRFFYLTKRNKKAKNEKAKLKIHWNPKIAIFFTFFSVALIGLIYIIEINSLATKGYHIRDLEQKISELKEINRELEDRNLTLQSINSINEKINELNMVEVTDVRHLSLKEKEVAIAK